MRHASERYAPHLSYEAPALLRERNVCLAPELQLRFNETYDKAPKVSI
jgi:hypothetical protein